MKTIAKIIAATMILFSINASATEKASKRIRRAKAVAIENIKAPFNYGTAQDVEDSQVAGLKFREVAVAPFVWGTPEDIAAADLSTEPQLALVAPFNYGTPDEIEQADLSGLKQYVAVSAIQAPFAYGTAEEINDADLQSLKAINAPELTYAKN